jgi:hypothetical protein
MAAPWVRASVARQARGARTLISSACALGAAGGYAGFKAATRTTVLASVPVRAAASASRVAVAPLS